MLQRYNEKHNKTTADLSSAQTNQSTKHQTVGCPIVCGLDVDPIQFAVPFGMYPVVVCRGQHPKQCHCLDSSGQSSTKHQTVSCPVMRLNYY